tara:strand:- start:6 stop:311 length:306 start_codon:yes stop_codon:yes gene_type:complete
MGKEQPDEEEKEQLSEIEVWELEKRMLELAYDNSYRLLTDKCTFEDLMVDNHSHGRSAVLAHDPHEGATYEEVFNILFHYELHEEYEKCAELKPVLDVCRE